MTVRPLRLVAALLLLAVSGCGSSSPATPAGPVTYTQADLAGTWERVILFSNDSPGWYQEVSTIDAAGNFTRVSCRNNTGAFVCATGASTFSIDTGGVVTSSGNAAFRAVLSRSKNLMVATAVQGVENNFQVFRRRVAGLAYSQADVAGPFAYHAQQSGTALLWERGAGTISSVGDVTVTSALTSTGDTSLPPVPADTITVAADGTLSTANGGIGFVAPDKQSAFFVSSTGTAGAYAFYAILKTGGSFAQADLTGAWEFNVLGSGATQAASPWTRGTATFDAAGVATFTNATTPAGATTLTSFTVAVSAGGVMTRADNTTFGGQLSLGKDFYVRTQTAGGANSIGISLRR